MTKGFPSSLLLLLLLFSPATCVSVCLASLRQRPLTPQPHPATSTSHNSRQQRQLAPGDCTCGVITSSLPQLAPPMHLEPSVLDALWQLRDVLVCLEYPRELCGVLVKHLFDLCVRGIFVGRPHFDRLSGDNSDVRWMWNQRERQPKAPSDEWKLCKHRAGEGEGEGGCTRRSTL